MSRIVWKLIHDEEPAVVDHIDGNPNNNRLINLRAATVAQNTWNRRAINRSGYKGVAFKRGMNRWMAKICVHGRSICLGYFDNPAAAHEAYKRAANENFGEFARAK